jgi:hypothetical protein
VNGVEGVDYRLVTSIGIGKAELVEEVAMGKTERFSAADGGTLSDSAGTSK